jgi:hypothetical protein
MTMPVAAMPPCALCHRPYCISHQVPESHGCADAAKNSARMDATRDTAKSQRAAKDASRGDAKAKLDAKRAALAQDRQKKKK